MRIIFKSVHIQNQEIVKFELNEPWKTCYEEGMKWLKTQEMEPKAVIPGAKARRSYVCFCAPSDGRCPPYRRTMVRRGLSESEGLAHHRTEQCRSTMASLAEALVGAD